MASSFQSLKLLKILSNKFGNVAEFFIPKPVKASITLPYLA